MRDGYVVAMFGYANASVGCSPSMNHGGSAKFAALSAVAVRHNDIGHPLHGARAVRTHLLA